MTAAVSRTGSGGQAGFTLVELLVAIVLLGMLSALLFGGLRFGTRIWERANAAVTSGDRVRTAQNTISGALRNIYPFFKISPTDRHMLFDGDPSTVTFFEPSDRDGLDVMTIALTADGTIIYQQRADLGSKTAGPAQTVLLRGVRSFNLAYFGAQSVNAPQRWYGSWHDALALPDLIRVRATLIDASAKWPDLVIAPRLSADEGCNYSRLTKYCLGRS